MAEAIAGPRSAIETTFLEMGQHLMTGAKLLRDVSTAHQDMPREFHGPQFLEAVEIMQILGAEIGRLSGTDGKEDVRAEHLASVADALHGPIDSLKKAVNGLRLIAVNARIVAAGLHQDSAEFGAFTLDMIDLGNAAKETVGRVERTHALVIGKVGEARQGRRAVVARHAATTAIIAQRLGAQIEAIEKHRASALGLADEGRQVAGRIGGRIGEAVSALQIGDITRQRLEHIEDALRAAASLAERPDPPGDTVRGVCHLQSLQLRDTQDGFERQVRHFAATLRRLAEDTETVLLESRARADALVTASGTALAALVADLKSTGRLLDDYEDTRATLRALGEEAEGSMRVMLEQLEAVASIEHSIRLLSLNMAIRCSRLGREGGPLKVIAQEMREFAGQTVHAASDVRRFLDEARDLVQAHDAATDGSASTAVANAIDLLEGVLARLGQNVSTIRQSAPQAVRLLNEAAEHAGRYEGGESSWATQIGFLEEWSCATGTAVSDNLFSDAAFFAELRARYTMESERLIHDMLCGAAERAAAPTPEDEEIDAMLF